MNDRVKKSLPADWDLLLVVLLLALALRTYFAVAFDVSIAAGYAEDFVAMASNPLPAAEGAPKYPLLLKYLLSLSGGSLLPVFLINTILGSASVVMLYYAGSFLCSRRAGLVAALTAAVYPGFILYTISPTPAAPVIFLTSALILLGATGAGRSRRSDLYSALTGLTVSAGVIIEPALAFLIPGLIASARSRFVLILVIAAILLPLAISHSKFEREPVLLYKSEFWRIDLDKYRSDHFSGIWRPVRKIYENAAFITDRGWKVGHEADSGPGRDRTYISAYLYIVILILGLVGLARKFRKGHLPVLLPFLIYFILLVLLTIFEVRYRTVLEPLLVLYMGVLLGGRCCDGQAAGSVESIRDGS